MFLKFKQIVMSFYLLYEKIKLNMKTVYNRVM